MLLLLSLFSSDVQAVPLQVTQQGRILDSSGASVSGSQMVVFRVYDDPTAGNKLWEEMQTVNFTNGGVVAQIKSKTHLTPRILSLGNELRLTSPKLSKSIQHHTPEKSFNLPTLLCSRT